MLWSITLEHALSCSSVEDKVSFPRKQKAIKAPMTANGPLRNLCQDRLCSLFALLHKRYRLIMPNNNELDLESLQAEGDQDLKRVKELLRTSLARLAALL